jgi:hypothetical protein
MSHKCVIFLISENSGTLPNTADKRYPMFRLETTMREQFRPLIDFLSYVGADFTSTRKLCQRALHHPFVAMSRRVGLSVLVICMLALWAYCLVSVYIKADALANGNADIQTAVVLAHCPIFIILLTAAFFSFTYSSFLSFSLAKQWRARKRASLKTLSAEFSRDDWVGIIPDLHPGGKLYDVYLSPRR